MKGVKAPQRTEPVIGVMGQPVGAVHGHDRERNDQPAGPVRRRSQLDPACVITDERRRPDAEQGHQRDHDDGVQGQETRILDVAAGQNRPTLGRPYPFADPGHDDERDEQGSGEFGAARREHGSEAALPEQPGDGDPEEKGRYPGQDKRGGAQAPPSAPSREPDRSRH
jgi:hypothetical protein